MLTVLTRFINPWVRNLWQICFQRHLFALLVKGLAPALRASKCHPSSQQVRPDHRIKLLRTRPMVTTPPCKVQCSSRDDDFSNSKINQVTARILIVRAGLTLKLGTIQHALAQCGSSGWAWALPQSGEWRWMECARASTIRIRRRNLDFGTTVPTYMQVLLTGSPCSKFVSCR